MTANVVGRLVVGVIEGREMFFVGGWIGGALTIVGGGDGARHIVPRGAVQVFRMTTAFCCRNYGQRGLWLIGLGRVGLRTGALRG